MWKFLYQLSSPQVFYDLTGRWTRWFGVLAFCFLLIGCVWGLGFAPADYQQGDAFRIIYVHVPCAFLSLSLYALMGFLSVLLLVWRIKLAGVVLQAVAQFGALMTLLALITGSLWGKPMWGAWWVWDARLTSELILLFLYVAILSVGYAYDRTDQADKIVAILCLVGLVDLPIIHYSVYWWNSLHQGATFSILSKPKIHITMAYPLFMMLFGFGLFAIWSILTSARDTLLWRERRQSWVVEKV
jgi:heme exporter protein C